MRGRLCDVDKRTCNAAVFIGTADGSVGLNNHLKSSSSNPLLYLVADGPPPMNWRRELVHCTTGSEFQTKDRFSLDLSPSCAYQTPFTPLNPPTPALSCVGPAS